MHRSCITTVTAGGKQEDVPDGDGDDHKPVVKKMRRQTLQYNGEAKGKRK